MASEGYSISVPESEIQEMDRDGSARDFARTGQPDYDYQYLKTLADNQRHTNTMVWNNDYEKKVLNKTNKYVIPPQIAREGTAEYYAQYAPEMSEDHKLRYFGGHERVYPTEGTRGADFQVPYQYHPEPSMTDKILNTYQNLVKHLTFSK